MTYYTSTAPIDPSAYATPAEAAWDNSEREFGYGWELLAVDPEMSNLISANDIPVKDGE